MWNLCNMCITAEVAEKITNFFDKLPKDAPIRWISTPQPAKKTCKVGAWSIKEGVQSRDCHDRSQPGQQ